MKKFKKKILILIIIFVVGGIFVWGYFDKPAESPVEILPAASESSKPVKRKIPRLEASENPNYNDTFLEAERFFTNGEFSEALTAYARASSFEPRAIEPYIRMGNISLALTDYDKAEEYFLTARNLEPENNDVRLYLTQTALKKKDFASAQQFLAEIDPKTDQSIFYEALIAAALNQPNLSQELLRKVLETSKNSILKQQTQQILDVYQTFALNRGGKEVHLQALLANAFNSINQEELALALAFEALKLKHDYRDIWILIGHASLKLGKFQDASEALEKAVQLDSEKPESHFYLGLAQKELKKWSQASRSFVSAKNYGFKPSILATQQLAQVYLELKEFENALNSYEELLAFDATNINSFVQTVYIALEKLNNTKKATELITWALEMHPDQALTHNLVGWIKLKEGRLNDAEKALKKALELNPNLEAATYNLAQVEEAKGALGKAAALYKKAYEQAQTNGESDIANKASEHYNSLEQ